MPQNYTIDRETGRKESGAIYMETPPKDTTINILPKKISMDIPIGYHPMYLYADNLPKEKMYYLVLRSHVEDCKNILMYMGKASNGSIIADLHQRPVIGHRLDESKKAGGWSHLGAVYMSEITFPDLGGHLTKILRKEVAKYAGMMCDSSGKIIHREKPDLITLVQGEIKKKLEGLF